MLDAYRSQLPPRRLSGMSVLTIDVQCNPDNAEEKRRPAMGRGPAGERGRPTEILGRKIRGPWILGKEKWIERVKP
jgi:hypothetical protein